MLTPFIELIAQRETFSGKTQDYFHYVQTAADRVNALIDTVYFYTRLNGSDEIPHERCDVARALAEVQVNIKQLIGERGAVVTSGALPHVWANYTQLAQLLQNLICNAIQHSGTTPHIHVEAVEAEENWQLRVRDNGPGIAEKDREKIFQPFKRKLDAHDKGLGLGLAICKKIVESHGEKIWYEAAPDGGSVFVFSLPKISAALSADAVAPIVATGVRTTDDGLATILLADDSNADLELTQVRLLEHRGLKCHLLLAHHGEEALEVMQRENGAVDLLLLDVNMPEVDGFEVLERLRKNAAFAHTAVIMCTGSIYDKDMARAQALGAVGYLVKPIKFELLQAALQKIPGLTLRAQGDGYALLREHESRIND